VQTPEYVLRWRKTSAKPTLGQPPAQDKEQDACGCSSFILTNPSAQPGKILPRQG